MVRPKLLAQVRDRNQGIRSLIGGTSPLSQCCIQFLNVKENC